MTKGGKLIEYSIDKPSLEAARQLSEEYLLKLEEREAAEAESRLTPVEKLVKDIERQGNMKVTVTDKFSIETSVAFWQKYLNSRRPRGWRVKPTEAEQVANDGVII